MAGIIIPVASFKTNLTSKITAADTVIPIDSTVDDDGNTLNGKVIAVCLEKGTDQEETVEGTVDSALGALTSSTRGLDPQTGLVNASLAKAHKKKKTVECTAHPYLIRVIRAMNGIDGIDAAARPQLATDTDATNDLQLVNKGELARTAVAGATNASTTQRGIVEIATAPEALAGTTDTGGTGALLGIIPSTLLGVRDAHWTTDYTYGATISAGQVLYLDPADAKWKVATSAAAATSDANYGFAVDAGINTDTGKRVALPGSVITGLSGLTPGFQFLSTAGALTAAVGTYRKMVGFAPNATTLVFYPGIRIEDMSGANSSATTANLNELLTLINTTDITGAELETLSAGATSVADTLHTHWPPYFRTNASTVGNIGSNASSNVRVKNDMQFTTTQDGSKMYAMRKVISETIATVQIFRFDRDTITGNYYFVSQITTSGVFGTGASCGIFVGTTNVWLVGGATGGANIAIRRYALDLTGETTITVSGTANTADIGHCAGDDTHAFVRTRGASTVTAVYSISGTTATRGTDINMTDAETSCHGNFFDGTNLFYLLNDGSVQKIKRHNQAGTLGATFTGDTFSRLSSYNVGAGVAVDNMAGFIEGLGVHRAGTLFVLAAVGGTQVGSGSGAFWIEGIAVTKP